MQIEILYCGICHTDLHFVRNEFANIMPTTYPCVPGHEIVGRVAKIGTAVTKFKEGDLAAVGCMVDSDRTCEACREGEEQFCASQPIFTYNGPDQHLGGVTYGGYSESVVVDEDFVLLKVNSRSGSFLMNLYRCIAFNFVSMKPSAIEHRSSVCDGHLLQVSRRTKLSANNGILALPVQ